MIVQPSDIERLLIEHKIQLAPILSQLGRIEWWTAEFRKASEDGQNFCTMHRRGQTPCEAIAALLDAGPEVLSEEGISKDWEAREAMYGEVGT